MKYKSMIEKASNKRFILIIETGLKVYEDNEPQEYKRLRKLWKNAIQRKEKEDCMKSLGLIKCYGSQTGKIYWE